MMENMARELSRGLDALQREMQRLRDRYESRP
jgi:hypothetical protein